MAIYVIWESSKNIVDLDIFQTFPIPLMSQKSVQMVMRPIYLKFELRTHFVVPFCKYFLVNIFMASDILIPLGKSFKNELLPEENG